jgi:CelD/BcsL family acetyltransferase involved in cellulose biosynthesis
MVEIQEIDNIEELSHYRLLWNSLFRSTPSATFFHTYDWLETAWRHFGRNQQLRVLVARAAGQPLGILPLCIRTEKYRVGNVRVLTYPLDNWGTWYGPIGPNPCATMMAAMQHLRTREQRDWDMIELRWIGPESVECGRTARAMRAAGMLTERCEYQTTSVIDLPGGWEQYLASKSSKSRRDLRRSMRRVFDDPSVEYIRHRPVPAAEGDGDPRWDLYEECEEVARSSWQGSVTNGNTLTHEGVRDYYRDAHVAAARLGMVDVNVIHIAGRPAAFLYSYHHQGQVTLHRTGYDASQAENGIGFGLLLKSLEDSCSRGDHSVDFGPGEREQKRRLRTRVESTYRLTYAPFSSWRSQAVQWSRWAKNRWQQRAAVAAM